jgi:hypothetical protein
MRLWDLGRIGTAVAVKPPDKPPVTEKPPDKPPVKPPDKPAPMPMETVKKDPPPDAAKQSEAEKVIKEVYRADYAKVKPVERAALAGKLVQKAVETKDDSVGRFVLLREARELATGAADIPTALLAIGHLDEWYAVDALDMKFTALSRIGSSPLSPALSKILAEKCNEAFDEALVQDKYDTAGRLQSLAETAAKRVQSPALQKEIQARGKELADAQKDAPRVKAAADTLKTKPDDPEANLTLGKHLCFRKGDWDKGLPMLAAGGDAALQSLAKKDLAKPDEAPGQVEVADAWWDRGDAAGGTAKAHMQQRAAAWYRQAKPSLTGLSLEKVDKRLKESEQASIPVKVPTTLSAGELRRYLGNKGPVYVAGISADGRKIFAAGADGTFRVWDLATAKEQYSLKHPNGEIRAAAWSPDGKYACTGNPKSNLVFWDLDNKQEFPVNSGLQPNCVVFLPDSRRVLAGRSIGWASEMGFIGPVSQRAHTTKPVSSVGSVAVSDNGRAIVYGCADGSWYHSDGFKNGTRATGHNGEVAAIAVSRDGSVVATAGADSLAKVWIAANQQTQSTLKGHSARVNSVAITADNRRVVTASDDKTIRIWDAKTGKQLRMLSGHSDAVTSVTITPDGKHLVSASADKTVRLWDMSR